MSGKDADQELIQRSKVALSNPGTASDLLSWWEEHLALIKPSSSNHSYANMGDSSNDRRL